MASVGTLSHISVASNLLLLVLGFLIVLFWVSFLLLRIFRYRFVYNTLVSRWSYNPAEFNIDVFNLKVKIVIYTFLLMISAEFLGGFGYCVGLLSFTLGFPGVSFRGILDYVWRSISLYGDYSHDCSVEICVSSLSN